MAPEVPMSPTSGQKVSLSLFDLLTPMPESQARVQSPMQRNVCRNQHTKTVLKNEKFDEISRADALVTTMMLRNIPNKYTQSDLLEEIDKMGFADTYDFAYLPMDSQTRTNISYAFINFKEPVHATRFSHIFTEHRFQTHQSRKISSVSAAHLQGFEANVLHFATKAVAHAKKSMFRPLFFQGSKHVDFEEAVAEVKARSAAAKLCPSSIEEAHHGQACFPGPDVSPVKFEASQEKVRPAAANLCPTPIEAAKQSPCFPAKPIPLLPALPRSDPVMPEALRDVSPVTSEASSAGAKLCQSPIEEAKLSPACFPGKPITLLSALLPSDLVVPEADLSCTLQDHMRTPPGLDVASSCPAYVTPLSMSFLDIEQKLQILAKPEHAYVVPASTSFLDSEQILTKPGHGMLANSTRLLGDFLYSPCHESVFN